MWTATVTDKQIDKRGNLVVTVLFTDGVRAFTEAIETAYGQVGTWLEDRVSVRLKALEAIDAMPVPEPGTALGKKPDPKPEPVDPERAAYAADVSLMASYRVAILYGLPLDKTPEFADLQARLIANFKPEYLGLF